MASTAAQLQMVYVLGFSSGRAARQGAVSEHGVEGVVTSNQVDRHSAGSHPHSAAAVPLLHSENQERDGWTPGQLVPGTEAVPRFRRPLVLA